MTWGPLAWILVWRSLCGARLWGGRSPSASGGGSHSRYQTFSSTYLILNKNYTFAWHSGPTLAWRACLWGLFCQNCPSFQYWTTHGSAPWSPSSDIPDYSPMSTSAFLSPASSKYFKHKNDLPFPFHHPSWPQIRASPYWPWRRHPGLSFFSPTFPLTRPPLQCSHSSLFSDSRASASPQPRRTQTNHLRTVPSKIFPKKNQIKFTFKREIWLRTLLWSILIFWASRTNAPTSEFPNPSIILSNNSPTDLCSNPISKTFSSRIPTLSGSKTSPILAFSLAKTSLSCSNPAILYKFWFSASRIFSTCSSKTSTSIFSSSPTLQATCSSAFKSSFSVCKKFVFLL